MRRRWSGFWLAVMLFVLFAAMPLWQLADWRSAKREKEEAVVLLYQVALFQMEMMGSSIAQKSAPSGTAELEEWRRALFSAAYAHERLSTAVHGSVPSKLDGLETLMQWITRVQVGGARPLAKEEAELLKQAAPLCSKLVAAYGRLMDGSSSISESAGSELKKTNAELAETVKKKLK